MIVVRISGGLGNQMFQYAFARALQARGQQVTLHWHSHHSKSAHNGYELDHVFQAQLSDTIPLVSQSLLKHWQAWRLRKIARTREVHELQFQAHFLETQTGYLDGYWQTEQYFESIHDKICADFDFKPLTGPKNLELQQQLTESEACSIHIRRGDYTGHPELGGICDKAYYNNALKELDARHPNCPLVVFSDDIEFSKDLLKGRKQVQFCDWNRGIDSWMDMALMCRCTHHIIANSSFSWWGAWLATSHGLTIAPNNWSLKFGTKTDICPTNWLTL
ncbi:MAG: O-antigen biosynthesis glycosyltransferase WbnK [Opitutia bacterium UBA7350]|nr:MAG: O-antigen biosynthesis glycosyltransferase WbnK [Opitutae bacterium UBA7350]